MDTPTASNKNPASARTRGSKLLAFVVLGTLVLAVTLYAAWWKIVADQLLDGVDRWRVGRVAEGIAVTWAGAETSGFPGDVVITIAEPEVRVPGAWSWLGQSVALSVSPLSLDVVAFRADGEHVIEDFGSAGPRRYEVAAETLRGTARGNQDAGAVAFDVGNATVRADGRDIGFIRSLAVALDRPAQPVTPDQAALVPPIAFDLAVALAYEDRTAAIEWLDVGDTQHADFRAIVRGNTALPLTRRGLEPWRDAGGVLELVSLSAHAGPLHLSGDGTFSLDHALQPVGALSVSLKGYNAVVDGLVSRGQIGSRDAQGLKALLGLLARGNGANGDKVLSAALSMQDRTVFLGPLELMKVPPVSWPD